MPGGKEIQDKDNKWHREPIKIHLVLCQREL